MLPRIRGLLREEPSEAYIKGAGHSGSDLAVTKTRCSSPIHSSAPGPSLRDSAVPQHPYSGGLLPLQVVITHDVLQGLRDREAIFQHRLHGVEPSEFSETEKRDDRERERRSPTTTSRRTTRPRSRPSSKPSSRTRRGRQLARSTANGPAARGEHAAEKAAQGRQGSERNEASLSLSEA